MIKNQKGITLIALVITIIVLLILAGVSIAMLTGENGILSQATRAGSDSKVADAKELASLDVSDLVSKYYELKYVDKSSALDDVADAGTYVKANLTSSDETKYTVNGSKEIEIKSTTSEGKTVKGIITNDGVISWQETPAS